MDESETDEKLTIRLVVLEINTRTGLNKLEQACIETLKYQYESEENNSTNIKENIRIGVRISEKPHDGSKNLERC